MNRGAVPFFWALLFVCLLPGQGSGADGGTVRLVFLIDYDDFLCPSCLESFLSFCSALPDNILETQSFGILSAGDKGGDGRTAMITKKLRCFIKANGIKFPIVFDTNGGASGFQIEGSVVLLLDLHSHSFRQYLLPVSPAQFQEISSLLLNSQRDF